MSVLNFYDILMLKPDFFDDAEIDDRINRKEMCMTILKRCGTLFPLYTDSTLFKIFSDNFFFKKKETITRLIDTTELEYNPIENYNRIEENERNADGSRNENKTTNGTNENKVSSFDSNSYQPRDQNTNTETDTIKHDEQQRETFTSNIHGNIGVTTNQTMITDERKIVLFNIYDWIAVEFEQEFFICVS